MIIPYGKQNINEEDIESVLEVLRSDTITQGTKVIDFEKEVAKYCGALYGVAANSATSCLHISMMSLGVLKDDIVWTSPISFVATSNSALYCEAKVDFIDISPVSYNIDVEKLEDKLIKAEKLGRLPKVLVPVHLSGRSCEMKRIHELSKKFNFKIMEDASHAIGASYLESKVGCCKFSDITIFSFHPVKIITTAEGGIALTNNKEISIKMALLRSHGVIRNKELYNSEGPWFYEQVKLGYNYRMNEIQAALGLTQLKRLDLFVKRRVEIANRYFDLLKDIDVQLPLNDSESSKSSWHLFIIRTSKLKFMDRRELYDKLTSNGIKTNIHYIPIYKHPFYRKFNYDVNCFPESEKYYKEAISIPIYYDLDEEKQSQVVKAIIRRENYQDLF